MSGINGIDYTRFLEKLPINKNSGILTESSRLLEKVSRLTNEEEDEFPTDAGDPRQRTPGGQEQTDE